MLYRLVSLLVFCCSFIFYEATLLSEEIKPFVYDSKGRRDPFVSLFRGEVRSYTSLDSVNTLDDLMLEGILWDSKGGSIAILNGVILSEGDKVNNIHILEITPRKVFLRLNNIEHELILEERMEGGGK